MHTVSVSAMEMERNTRWPRDKEESEALVWVSSWWPWIKAVSGKQGSLLEKILKIGMSSIPGSVNWVISLSRLTSLGLSLFGSKAPSSSNLVWCYQDPLEKQPTRGISHSMEFWDTECNQGSHISWCVLRKYSCWCMAKPIQYCKVISLQLK